MRTGVARAALAASITLCLVPVAGAAEGPSPAELWVQEGQSLRDLAAASRSTDRGEALLRLGDWERASVTRLRRATDDGRLSAADGERLERQHLDAAEAALSAAERLASRDRLPQVLFSLGDLRRLRGNASGAASPLAQLVRMFPGHPLAVDAATALGDDAFDAGRLAEALKQYAFADGHARTGGAKAYARYKLAWCYLNLEDQARARSLFLQVIGLAGSDRTRLSLADEARRDFVLALARDATVTAGQAQAAVAALHLSPDRTRRYEQGYAAIIAGAGRDTEAAHILSGVESGAPAADAIHIFTAELEIAVRQRDVVAAVADGQRLANTLSAFPRAGGDAIPAAERALRIAAVTLHGEGRARGLLPTLQGARDLYDDYFLVFDTTPAAYELHHHAGELHVALREPALAERDYTAAVERDLARLGAHEPPGKWLQQSALGAVDAALDAMPPVAAPLRQRQPGDEDVDRARPVETALSEAERVLVAACDRYRKALPAGADAVQVAYQRALVLYRHNRLKEAEPELEAIALQHPDLPPASFAAELALDALRFEGEYDRLSALALAFREKRALAGKLGPELVDVHEAAILAAAARDSHRGEYAMASTRYLAFADHYRTSPRLDRALYNASAALAMDGRIDAAVRARERLLREVPRSPLAKRARERQLSDLVQLGRFPEAEQLAIQLVAEATGADAATRLHDAVVIAEAAGDLRGADTLRQRSMKEHPRSVDAMPYALALLNHARGCAAQEVAAHQAVTLAPDVEWRTVALTGLAQHEARCHEEGLAHGHAGQAVWLGGKLKADRSEGLDAAAEAALILIDEDARKYRSLTLAAPFERTLPRKLSALKVLDDRLAKVVERGRAAAAVCALVESGQAYAELAHELERARPPRGFTADQRELFKDQLAEKSQPLLDHAKQTLVEALTRARQARANPVCLGGARQSLADLWPERFGRQLEAVVPLTRPIEPSPHTGVEILTRAPDAPAAWLIASQAVLATHPEAAIVLAGRVPSADFLSEAALEVKAAALELLGQSEAALVLWAQLATEHPERAAAHRVLADRAMADRDFEAARDQLTALRKMAPDDASVAMDLGVALHGTGKLPAAEEAFRAALSLAPTRPDTALDLGLLLCGDAGHPAEGIKLLDRFESEGGHCANHKACDAARAACRALGNGGRP